MSCTALALTLALAQAPTLKDVWGAEVERDLGPIPALEATSVEELRAAALALRDVPNNTASPTALEPGDALPAAPPLDVEGQRARVQDVAAWSAANASAAPPFVAEIRSVRSPKSFVVATDDGATRGVQLYGVTVPRLDQAGGSEANRFAATHLEGARVTVIPVSESGNGRDTFALVLLSNPEGGVEPAGEALVRRGLAWWNERYAPLDARLKQLFFAAQDAGTGLFGIESSMSPGAFRNLTDRRRKGYAFGGEIVEAQVIEATDGDTLDVRLTHEDIEALPALAPFLDPEGVVTIRLSGVDTPEIDQPGGLGASAISYLTCHAQTVNLILLDEGGYGRVAARVICPDGEPLGEKLVRMGRARHYEFYLPDARLAALEAAARRAGVGIWSSEHSILPGAWRDVQSKANDYWKFGDEGLSLVVDADGDPATEGDQQRVSGHEYKGRLVKARFDALCEAWSDALSH